MSNIEWDEETRKLSELIPYNKNPRRISKKRFDDLVRDLKERGYGNRVKINVNNVVAGGHQRLKALKLCGYDVIKVLVANRLLTDEEFEREVIADNLPYGEYDKDILANKYDVPALLRYGMTIEDIVGDTKIEEPKLDIEPDPTNEKCSECGRAL